jgi:hypothetical protein
MEIFVEYLHVAPSKQSEPISMDTAAQITTPEMPVLEQIEMRAFGINGRLITGRETAKSVKRSSEQRTTASPSIILLSGFSVIMW